MLQPIQEQWKQNPRIGISAHDARENHGIQYVTLKVRCALNYDLSIMNVIRV